MQENIISSNNTGKSLAGKVALITGSTSGIGLGVANSLAQQGAHIILNGFGDTRAIEQIKVGIARDNGVDVLYSNADMTKPDSIAAMIAKAERQFGTVDILVNNAGILHVAPISNYPPEKWEQIIAINLTSAFHTIRHALPLMRMKGFGRIINMASAVGLVGAPFMSAYVAAKHGIIGLTKTVALEAAEEPITCNAICPGNVATPLAEAEIDAQVKALGMSRESVIRDIMLVPQPNKRFASVDEIGALAAFLATESAASITGAAISVDGGWTAH